MNYHRAVGIDDAASGEMIVVGADFERLATTDGAGLPLYTRWGDEVPAERHDLGAFSGRVRRHFGTCDDDDRWVLRHRATAIVIAIHGTELAVGPAALRFEDRTRVLVDALVALLCSAEPADWERISIVAGRASRVGSRGGRSVDEPLSLRDTFVHLLARAGDATPDLVELREEHVLDFLRVHHAACDVTAEELAHLRAMWQRQVDAVPLWTARFGPKVGHERQLKIESLRGPLGLE